MGLDMNLPSIPVYTRYFSLFPFLKHNPFFVLIIVKLKLVFIIMEPILNKVEEQLTEIDKRLESFGNVLDMDLNYRVPYQYE
jgi:hypothetical protein